MCPQSPTSNFINADGCVDTDDDGVPDSSDLCPTGFVGWISDTTTDYDGDGCRDESGFVSGISFNANDNDVIPVIDTNDEGYVAITGTFKGTATFGGHTLSACVANGLGGNSNRDIFVGLIAPNGTWLWANSFGGVSHDDEVGDVVIDSNNNVTVIATGGKYMQFHSDCNGPQQGNNAIVAAVVKYDVNGQLLWDYP